MRRSIVVAVLSVAVSVLFAPAAAGKGAESATVEGDGLGAPLRLGGSGEPGSGSTLGRLAEAAGFFPAVFGQSWGGLTSERPKGELGPRYTVTYVMPGPDGGRDGIRQDVYPYAEPFPLSYTPPGQPFFETEATRGGWFVAGPELRSILVAAGLPTQAPSAASDGGWLGEPWNAVATAFAAAVALALTALVLVRRRARPLSAG